MRRPAHPRACGENSLPTSAQPPLIGSSPRMRGKPGRARVHARVLGLIPAHAGKTIPYCGGRGDRTAHPRACGENVAQGQLGAVAWGSSPRMRGKLSFLPVVPRAFGLIPAHAGKTWGPSRPPASPEAHPRACGENRFFVALKKVEGGAHPRACGENSTYEYATACQLGSSPRMRGKHWMAARMTSTTGLIPAHAGKTMRETLSSPAEWAHPRACGENGETIGQAGCPAGSSPRMRGKL